jgi:hypothetical protein
MLLRLDPGGSRWTVRTYRETWIGGLDGGWGFELLSETTYEPGSYVRLSEADRVEIVPFVPPTPHGEVRVAPFAASG